MRSVLSKLTILHLSALLVFGFGLAILFGIGSFNSREQDRYFSAKWKKSLIEQFRQDSSTKMGALSDSAIWDSAYNDIRHPEKGWLKSNYTNAGENYGIDGLALFNKKGECVDQAIYGADPDNFQHKDLIAWLKSNKKAIQTSFFVRDGNHLDQYFVSTVHPSGDSKMQQDFSGYMVMCKEWSTAVQQRMARIAGVYLKPQFEKEQFERVSETNRFSVPIYGPFADQIANVIVETDLSHIEDPGTSTMMVMRLFAIFSIGLLLCLVQGVYGWIIKPFRSISKALASGDPEHLSELDACKSEFGLIAGFLKDMLLKKLQLEDRTFELENMVLSQESEIEQRKYRDPLTGLPNRRFLRECIDELSSVDGAFESVSMILLDIDDLQLINDGLYESAGDDLLIAVATKLRKAVPLEGVVVRYGGDEFGVLLPTVGTADSVQNVLFEIKSAFRQPMDCHGISFQCTFCIGVVTMVAEVVRTTKSLDLIRHADIALYQAKSAGKDKVVFYDEKLSKSLEKRVLTESGLRDAIKNKELDLHYQPIVTIQSGALHAVEALIRWNHPERGLIMPGEFISIAESSDLVVSMGYYKMKLACRQILKLWQDHPEVPRFVLSINLSGKQLDCPEIVDHVKLVLEMTDFPPELLQLEVTETTMAQNMELAVQRLNELRDLGVLIAIDDFGTGYSSMSSLTDLPADVLKVDMSFVQRLPHDLEAVSILRAVSSMARSFNLETVAEGVETEEQLEFLAILGYDHIQGWIMSKALPIANLESLLAADPYHFAHKLDVVKKLSDPEAA